MASMASARHRPTASVGPFRRFPPIPSSWPLQTPRIPVPRALYFPHGRRADSCVGPAWGKGRGRKAGDATGAASQRANFRSYSAALLSCPGALSAPGRTLLLVVGGVFSMLCCPRSASLLVIDRARGGLAANWPARISAIWNHLRTAAADSLPASCSQHGFYGNTRKSCATKSFPHSSN